MFVAVCCDRGAPGATTTALALASAWPEPAVLVEADPYGGDLSIRLRDHQGSALPEVPTLLTVAVAARTSTAPNLLDGYGHPLSESLRVIPGHLVAEQAKALNWGFLTAALTRSATPAVVDLGRIHDGSPSLPLAAAADVLVIVSPPTVSGMVHVRERLTRLIPAIAERRGTPPVVLPVLVGSRRAAPRQAEHLHEVLGASSVAPSILQVGWIAWDPGAVQRLEQGGSPHGFLARSALLRSARALVRQIHEMVPPITSARTSPDVVVPS